MSALERIDYLINERNEYNEKARKVVLNANTQFPSEPVAFCKSIFEAERTLNTVLINSEVIAILNDLKKRYSDKLVEFFVEELKKKKELYDDVVEELEKVRKGFRYNENIDPEHIRFINNKITVDKFNAQLYLQAYTDLDSIIDYT